MCIIIFENLVAKSCLQTIINDNNINLLILLYLYFSIFNLSGISIN